MDEQNKEWVDYSDICRAWRAWYACYGPDVGAFRRFTGWDGSGLAKIRMTREQARRVRLLAGPHGHTLLKAYLACKEPA